MFNLLKSNYCCYSSAFNLKFKRAITTSQLKEYYAILNVTKGSTQKEIKDSFLKLSKIYHPDNKETGSHLKFVKLKEAYDAIKEGPPAVTGSSYSRTTSSQTSSSSAYQSSSSYSRYNDPNINQKAQEFYRRRDEYFRNREASQNGSGFGGPFANSKTPWEDFKKSQEFRRRETYRYNRSFGGTPLIHVTVFLSAIAWIIIYSGVLLIWDYNDQIKKGMLRFKPRTHDEYIAYEEYLRRKQTEQLLRSKKAVGKNTNFPSNSKITEEDISENKIKKTSNNINNNDNNIENDVQNSSFNELMIDVPELKHI